MPRPTGSKDRSKRKRRSLTENEKKSFREKLARTSAATKKKSVQKIANSLLGNFGFKPILKPEVVQEEEEAPAAVITQEEAPEVQPQEVRKRARAPVHRLMQRKSARITNKTKPKQKQNQPSNDFANAFNDIPVLFVQQARESSAPLPPPQPPPPRRCIIPGMCGGCKKPGK